LHLHVPEQEFIFACRRIYYKSAIFFNNNGETELEFWMQAAGVESLKAIGYRASFGVKKKIL
jgi:hypothetical protein